MDFKKGAKNAGLLSLYAVNRGGSVSSANLKAGVSYGSKGVGAVAGLSAAN